VTLTTVVPVWEGKASGDWSDVRLEGNFLQVIRFFFFGASVPVFFNVQENDCNDSVIIMFTLKFPEKSSFEESF